MPVSAINRNVLLFLKKQNHLSTQQMDSLIVSSFLRYNNITSTLATLGIQEKCDKSLVISFLEIWKKYQHAFDLEKLIEIFEFVISPAEKEVNGAVYTPRYIREYIVDEIFKKLQIEEIPNLVFGDISCGCGGFLITVAKKLRHQYGLSYSWIYEHNVVGVDVAPYSVSRTKIMLRLLALLENEIIANDINIYCQNSLTYDFNNISLVGKKKGFDVIVGNPPYVGASKMDVPTKELVKKWSVAKSGKADMYIPFFQIAIENLREDGWLGYITVNNFYRSQNGTCLRQYFANNGYYIKMADFGSEQVFRGRSTYTCLCFVKRSNIGYVDYVACRSQSFASVGTKDYIRIPYAELSDNQWHLSKSEDVSFVRSVEATGIPLGKLCQVRNGFATLKNDVYLFSVVQEDNKYYYFTKKDKKYKVEKDVCRDAVKPNILKRESDLPKCMEKLIYPYEESQGKVTLISEDSFKQNYPHAYKYLCENKEILAKRDKGQKRYENWYAYGRTQAINLRGYKLLFPYIAEKPYFVLSEDKDLLFYNGYAIISNSLNDLKVLQRILSSSIFWKYIRLTSKPYGGEFFALAKNYIKKFGIYYFSEKEKRELLALPSQKEVDEWLRSFYTEV